MSVRPTGMEITWIFNKHAEPDGKIPIQKFTSIVEEYRSYLSESTIRKLVRYADANHDGYITIQELMKLDQEDEEVIAKKSGVKPDDIKKFKKGIKIAGNMVLFKEEDKRYYYNHYSCKPPPIFMIIISVIEFIVYVYYGFNFGEWMTYSSKLNKTPLIFDPKRREEVWRFLTYMFLHAGFEHILFNVLGQLLLGVPLEMVHGAFRVSLIYFAGVIGGSLASSIFDPYTLLVGASGGVYALFTAHLSNVILNGDVMPRLSKFLRIAIVLLPLSADFGISIYRRFQTTSSGVTVSFVAHVAGALAGVTVGVIVLLNFKKSLRDKIVFWIAVAIYFAVIVFAILWNVFWPYYLKS